MQLKNANTEKTLPRILITPGEPAGVGPDITIRIAQQKWPAEIIAIADPTLIAQRAKQIGLSLRIIEADINKAPSVHQPGTLKILPVTLDKPAEAGKPNPLNAPYVIRTLEMAAELCQKKTAQAVVTGPVHKGIINRAGINFTGHTEFFAQYCHIPHTVMLFVVENLKVALATTHIPLANVPSAITQESLRATLTVLSEALTQLFHIKTPRILVCGVNPHAGEGGYLGREEIDTMIPLFNELCNQDYYLEGPLPADTIFTPKYLERADAVLAMYHDQVLPLVKYIGFGNAVNLTLGLPFIRTSVDHGTAIDIAGTKAVDSGSLAAAMKLAIVLCNKA